MGFVAYKMKFSGERVDKSKIECTPFIKKYFDKYKKVYNECFYEMRKDLNVQPYNFLSNYDQIKNKVSDIYLLLDHEEIIGSVACYGNEIDDLIVNKKYQRQGYGRQLLIWAMNHIRQNNDLPITLHVAELNRYAVKMYETLGFTVEEKEMIR